MPRSTPWVTTLQRTLEHSGLVGDPRVHLGASSAAWGDRLMFTNVVDESAAPGSTSGSGAAVPGQKVARVTRSARMFT